MTSKRATFLIIERALMPPPPIDSEPYWCYVNILKFYQNRKEVWSQEIPEAKLSWIHRFRYNDKKKEHEYECDDFDKYFHCEVFKDTNLGWQLRIKISHGKADFWLKRILEFLESYHQEHFRLEKERQEVNPLKVISHDW